MIPKFFNKVNSWKTDNVKEREKKKKKKKERISKGRPMKKYALKKNHFLVLNHHSGDTTAVTGTGHI